MLNRRDFIEYGLKVSAGTIILGESACSNEDEKGKKLVQKKKPTVAPAEDLIQEHGLLNRILLIYDHYLMLINNKSGFDMDVLMQSALVITTKIRKKIISFQDSGKRGCKPGLQIL